MSREDAERRLKTFKYGHESALIQLASHAALPVVLDPDLVHLLRVNYFLDPPTILPYAAEAELLLSSVCTEVDQGLYVIDSDLRDVLLQHLVQQHGSSRLRDVARLLWEYSQRRIPWSGRPGLLEAQQLTALSFIDSARAQDWLARAEESIDAGTAVDERWFVAMRKDLEGRAAAVQRAEQQPGRVSFWEALDPVEREVFRSFASVRTFAAGARLIAEGDQADHVIVILSGRTKICVEENGRERVLAERGPGQLVGEQGALQVSVRSASVVALDQVQTLVARTADFAAFSSAHPRVLGIVEGQVYDRLSEHPGAYSPEEHPQSLNAENRTVILSDVIGFGARTRTDEDRRIIREALFSMMRTALHDLPDQWSWEDRGDGLLIAVPSNVSTALILRNLHKELPAALDEHNQAHHDSAGIRLRVAINVGPVVTDNFGVTGEGIIVTARLVEAPLFKQAMEKDHASLGLIVSTFIYDTVIRHDPNLTEYSEVQVNVKESSFLAWMKLFNQGS